KAASKEGRAAAGVPLHPVPSCGGTKGQRGDGGADAARATGGLCARTGKDQRGGAAFGRVAERAAAALAAARRWFERGPRLQSSGQGQRLVPAGDPRSDRPPTRR